MKKILTTLIFASLCSANAMAGDFDDCIACGDETVVDLIAGGGNEEGAMVVGQVIVNNCDTAVCVEYVLNDEAILDGWLITETHVEVADSLGGIPQTKKDNPIPGQFEDVQYFQDGVADYRYCVSFADIGELVAPGSEINVAAHAVVTRPSASGEWTQVWQIGDVEEVSDVTGRLTNYADEFNWGDPAGPTTLGPGLAQEKPSFSNPFLVGSAETIEFPYNSNTDKSYATNFDVQWTGALPWGGELIFSWSPGQSDFEEKQVTIDGAGPEIFTANGVAIPNEGWFADTYPLVEHSMPVGALNYGLHTINFQHTAGDGTFWDWVRLEQPGLESETAWAEGCGFAGKNWATYVCGYVVQECPTCPAITGYNSDDVMVLDAPLESVQPGVTGLEVPQVFAEYAGTDHGGFTLDINALNQTNALGSPDGYAVAAETPVCSYYVHFDDSNPLDNDQGLFDLTFEEPVLGLIVAGTIRTDDIFAQQSINTLCDTDDVLGNAATSYPAEETCGLLGDARGLEISNTDPTASGNQDPVNIVGNTVYLNLNIFNLHDSLRIILPTVPK